MRKGGRTSIALAAVFALVRASLSHPQFNNAPPPTKLHHQIRNPLALETFSYLDSLVVTNPDTNDSLTNGDDHIRGIKLTLKNTLPGLNSPATRVIGTGGFGFLAKADGTATAPAYSFATEPTLGLYRASTGLIGVAGGRLQGTLEAGAIQDFLRDTAPSGWLPCDGQLVNTADYPDLFAVWGYKYGGSGTQFRIPSLINRFRRHRDGAGVSGAVGAFQANQIGSHAHTARSDAQGYHAHSFSGVTGGMTANNIHDHDGGTTPGSVAVAYESSSGIGAYSFSSGSPGGLRALPRTGAVDINHGHPFSGGTDAGGQHAHNITVDAAGGTETRPDSVTVLTCVKT